MKIMRPRAKSTAVGLRTYEGRSWVKEALLAGLLALPVLVVTSTIEAGQWVPGLPSLKLAGLAGLAFGYIIGRGNVATWPGASASLLTAVVVGGALAIMAPVQSSGLVWLGGSLIALSWWTGYATGWLAYRGPFRLAVGFPGLVVILVILAFLPSSLHTRLLLYLLALAPVPVCIHLLGKHRRVNIISWAGLSVGALAMLAPVLAVAWAVPSPSRPVPLIIWPGLEEKAYSLGEVLSRPFAVAPNRRAPGFTLPNELPFTGPIRPSSEAMLAVTAPAPAKWRTRVYEIYTSQGWANYQGALRVDAQNAELLEQVENQQARQEIELTVRMHSKGKHLATAGLPLKANIPTVAEISPGRGERWWLAVAKNAEARPTLALEGTQILRPLQQYSTVGSVSVATPGDLRAAGRRYPIWITDRYLQLPPTFPASVRALAAELARGKNNAYDRAVAIEKYLATLPYSQDIVSPPPGRDGVEYFLFEQQVGYCQYYASAMITMLRSLGIPARLVVGFAPGVRDQDRNAWEIQARDYHAWPEVYFPGYGWVEFEPTPVQVQPSLVSLGSGVSQSCPQGLGNCPAAITPDESLASLFGEGVQDAPAEQAAVLPLERPFPWALVTGVILAGLVLAMGGAMAMYLRQRFNRLGVVAATYGTMCVLGNLAGVPRRPQDTPVEYGSRLAQVLPGYGDRIGDIARSITLARYGPAGSLPVAEELRLRARWAIVRKALARVIIRRLLGGNLRDQLLSPPQPPARRLDTAP